ncbi:response regulator [Mucilaginibacter sp. RS28]|uniref:Response regulator n=1 Tax=Mucilaginibacter straminoryzae TaxID=2932774 RepID=A0A9X2B9F1_9SPHI|nr:response regulator [Mucilaginibacter straminoryzae]MCJ8210554.1 response regulator [Mucilaginibacter straminoryzae]
MNKLMAIIDDDPAFQFITKRQLMHSGHKGALLQFFDGQEAFDYFKQNESEADHLPDLVLLDINMPYMDGWQFLDHLDLLNLAKENLIIYMVTSSNAKSDIQKAATYPRLAGYHIKPIAKERMIEMLAALN